MICPYCDRYAPGDEDGYTDRLCPDCKDALADQFTLADQLADLERRRRQHRCPAGLAHHNALGCACRIGTSDDWRPRLDPDDARMADDLIARLQTDGLVPTLTVGDRRLLRERVLVFAYEMATTTIKRTQAALAAAEED